MKRCKDDRSFFSHLFDRGRVISIVYVDGIIILRNDGKGIEELKTFLHTQFHIKNLGKLWYFWGIKVARSKEGIRFLQRKYVLEILDEIGLMGLKLVDTLMDPNVKLCHDQRELITNSYNYRPLVGKLNYLTITWLVISFAVRPSFLTGGGTSEDL